MPTDELNAYYFHQGTNFYSYEYLGCRLSIIGNKYHYCFRVWAPNADSVYLVSDFLNWDEGVRMSRVTERGIYECFYISDKRLDGALYKYKIISNGKASFKGDPYAKYSKGYDDGASIIYTSRFRWSDSAWLVRRKRIAKRKLIQPINVYEIHPASFLRHENGDYYSYRELADALIPYIKYMGYTHVELMPIMEYPYDGSWGYQVCSYFAPTSRFGEPDGLKYLINECHKNFIGVILDFVPAHFPKDEWGLFEFDGKPLYEYQGEDRQESKSWGTRFFDLGREEIQSFLISAALYYLREYHIDGLRFDAVASMIYLDYDRTPGEWIKNAYGGRESLEGISFLKKLNQRVRAEFPDCITIAEESGDIGITTKSTENGGLGFDMKWNMGFANDFFDYMSLDPIYRRYNHKALNFPIQYAFDERYVLPISHDELVHGKKSLIDKMHGSYDDKFKQMRCSMLLIMTYPGKKTTFMGTEFAQFREWDYSTELEWFMLNYEKHRAMREFVAALNRLYLERDELWEIDFESRGFEWINPDDEDKNCVSYKRYNKKREYLTVVINFSGDVQTVCIDEYGMKELFTTGENLKIEGNKITLSPFSGAILKNKTVSVCLEEQI